MRSISRITDCLHVFYAYWAILRYRFNYKKLCIVGVTGTDGKSSTVVLTARLLRKSGIKTAHYSSISIHNSEKETVNENKMTTPGRGHLHKFLADSVQRGATHAIVEITSEGIKQWRHFGILFDVLVYTNITPEHTERHGSFIKYKRTKLSLLKALKPHFKSTCGGVVLWNASDSELWKERSTFTQYANQGVYIKPSENDKNPFIGINYQLAKCVASQLHVTADLDDEEKFLPGRFELFRANPSVLVDYAHTPRAVEMCLEAARKLTSGKLIHVFGAAGGGRDSWKRPILAQLSEQYADVQILTEENSFDEPVRTIISNIQKGFSKNAEVYIEYKREEAIKKAFSLAKKYDLIVCTAKGSEVVIAGPRRSKRPYNERNFVTQCLHINQH